MKRTLLHNVRASHFATLPNLITNAALGDSSFVLLFEIVYPIIAFIPHHHEHTVTWNPADQEPPLMHRIGFEGQNILNFKEAVQK